MRFDLTLIPLALFASEVAATKIVFAQTVTVGIPVRTGYLRTDDGKIHNIGFRDSGCTTAGLKFVKEMCIDGPKRRAHIYWTKTPKKKLCFHRKTADHDLNCGKHQTCSKWEYVEVKCTW